MPKKKPTPAPEAAPVELRDLPNDETLAMLEAIENLLSAVRSAHTAIRAKTPAAYARHTEAAYDMALLAKGLLEVSMLHARRQAGE